MRDVSKCSREDEKGLSRAWKRSVVVVNYEKCQQVFREKEKGLAKVG
jgi:hypothetical protein